MNRLRHRLPLRLGLAWLVWLALLLPLAQSAAAWHAYSHAPAGAASRDDGKSAAHASHCDLCLTAAAVAGPGLPGKAPTLALPALAQTLHGAVALPALAAVPRLAYRSRAPPPALS